MGAVLEQHEETAGSGVKTSSYQQMQNILPLCERLRQIDENNIVEMQTNYVRYYKIPLH